MNDSDRHSDPTPAYTGWLQTRRQRWQAVVSAESVSAAWTKLLALPRTNGAALMVCPTGESPTRN